jgi:hypothetical protein
MKKSPSKQQLPVAFGRPAALAATLLCTFALGFTAHAQIGGLLKGGGIAVLVTKIAPDIDKFLNGITGNTSDSWREATKVVPILSIGKGTFVGAVQVSGPRRAVESVKAVAQVEGDQKLLGAKVRARVLIPIANQDVRDKNALTRVKGVGVSSLVDIQL